MKTKEMIEMLVSWSNDCHVWFDFDGHKANAAILLREAAHKLRENAGKEHEIEALKKLIGELKKDLAEREAAPGWISVEERLPEVGEDVLLKYENNLVSGFLQLGNEWCCYTGNGWVTAADESENPTHWMPIPKPPEQPKQVRTYEDVYRERIKEAFPELDVNHVKPAYCRAQVFSEEVDCDGIYGDCKACWNQPYPEEGVEE